MNEIVSQSGGTNRTLSYDANGSLTNDGLTRTFEWDAANRLVGINYTGTTNRSEFTYDGLNRCAKIVEKTNGSVTSTRKFVWSGNQMCEFRDADDTVTLFAYPQGQCVGTTKYLYFRDHLGSIREMMKANGTLVARFDYDPWGRSTTVLNTVLPDFNFTGLYRHSTCNLDLAVYRAYDPDLGRWLSRDPIAELGGVNLYGYVLNDAINQIDPLGLRAWRCRKALHALGGTGQRSGPDIPGNPLYHEYYCIGTIGRGIRCFGQDRARGPWGPGKPSEDHFSPQNCEEIPSGDCFEKCLDSKGLQPRPWYGLSGPGTNCQEWAERQIADCRKQCNKQCDAQ